MGYTSADANQRSIGSYHTAERILSAFGRVNYDWDGKYLASFTARRDGYSRLIGDNQYGVFPGASFGWLAHKEKFLQGTSDWLSLLKLRGSWGKNGNIGGIGLYELQGGYSTTGRYENIIGFSLGGIPNPKLRWEKTNTVEAAIEYGLLKNRITGSIGVYNRITNDKIANVLLPNSTGVSSIRTNNGSMQNKGFEADMVVKVIQNKDWEIRLGTNIAWNKNKILKLPFNGNENNRQGGTQIYDPATGKIIWVGGLQEGREPGELFGYVMEGLIRDAKDLADYNKVDLAAGQVQLNAAAGRPLISQKLLTQRGLNPNQWWTTSLGDVRWRDIDKNDTIDFRDRVFMGRTIPRWTGGFNLSLGWKGLQLFARMDYALGFVQMDFRQLWAMGSMQGEFNGTNFVKDSWTPENPNAKFPTYMNQDQQLKKNYDRYSNMFLVSSNYLCFRELTLSYAVPQTLLKRAKIEGLTLMVTGQNLGYISNKMLKLPERTGEQDGAYTIPTQLVFSANLTF
ncbi:MAG: TonB-dependent receptor [Chitinophagaceae bacterium]|nr:TonB-dependent receptor [Chitinophagaceae bacterium]